MEGLFATFWVSMGGIIDYARKSVIMMTALNCQYIVQYMAN